MPTSLLDDDVLIFPTRITSGADEDSLVFPTRITTAVDEDSIVFPSRVTSALEEDSIDYLEGASTSALDDSGTAAFVWIPGNTFGAIKNEPFFDLGQPIFGAVKDEPLDLTPTNAFSDYRDGDLDLTPHNAFSALSDDDMLGRVLAIRGPQFNSSPTGIGTANLEDDAFSADEDGRAKMASNFLDSAILLSSVSVTAITTSVVQSKIPNAAIPITKLAEPYRERLAAPDKNMFVATPTSGDGANTGLVVAGSPVAGGYVGVLVNGVLREVGDGVITKDCYFTPDGGTTIRFYGEVQTGDTLYWNGLIATFDLLTTDRVDFMYIYSSF